MSTRAMAVLVSVGPGAPEVRRFRDLVSSLTRYAPRGWLIVIDDNALPRRFSFLGELSPAWQVACLPNPYHCAGIGHLGRLTVGILTGLEWACQNTSCEFVLKLDTDALVTGSLDSLRSIAADPRVGVAGTIGRTPDHTAEPFCWEAACISPVLLARRSHPAATSALAPDIENALSNGYFRLIYCQGGAYMVTRQLLARMAEQGAFTRRHNWLELPVGEDIVVSMYARAAGLSLLDASLPGQPFSSKWRGLAFTPAQLIARGHSLIHSVRNDSNFTEPHIRRFFRHLRGSVETLPPRPGRFFLYASPAAHTLARSRRPKTVLAGGHAPAPDISLLDAGLALSPEGRRAVTSNPTLSVVLFSRRPLPSSALPAGMKLIQRISNVQALHLTEGFALQYGSAVEAYETAGFLARQLRPLRTVLRPGASRNATPAAILNFLRDVISRRPALSPEELMSAISRSPRCSTWKD